MSREATRGDDRYILLYELGNTSFDLDLHNILMFCEHTVFPIAIVELSFCTYTIIISRKNIQQLKDNSSSQMSHLGTSVARDEF